MFFTAKNSFVLPVLIGPCLFLVNGTSLDEILLEDLLPKGSSLCKETGTSSYTFKYTPNNASEWSDTNSRYEHLKFLAEIHHEDDNPNRTWTARFGQGGDLYSFQGAFGEAIAPQVKNSSVWMDEVIQTVSVNTEKNDVKLHPYYIHQAGIYMTDEKYLPPPFWSPNIAKLCKFNSCSFATWGQQAWVPTAFKSGILYFHRYRDCGNGVIEYTQGVQNNGNHLGSGDRIDYLQLPWAGVRRSKLQSLLVSDTDRKLSDYIFPIQKWGYRDQWRNLDQTGGFTTFAVDLPLPPGKKSFELPCYKGSVTKTSCSASDIPDNFTHIELVAQSNNSCEHVANADLPNDYVVRCRWVDSKIGNIAGCNTCGSPTNGLQFTNARTGASVRVSYVLFWVYNSIFTYFVPNNASASDLNIMFLDLDEIIVTYYTDPNRRFEDNYALTFVHGIDKEFRNSNSDWYRAPSQLRFGQTGPWRDFTVLAIVARIALNPGKTFVSRQYLVSGEITSAEETARLWVDETLNDVMEHHDFNGRFLEIYSNGANSFGVAAAIEPYKNTTHCSKGSSTRCFGRSTPQEGMSPFFAITCGNMSYFGPDLYAFAPKRTNNTGDPSTDEPLRSYVCDGLNSKVRPKWKLLGFFPIENSKCASLQTAQYQETFCVLDQSESLHLSAAPSGAMAEKVTQSPSASSSFYDPSPSSNSSEHLIAVSSSSKLSNSTTKSLSDSPSKSASVDCVSKTSACPEGNDASSTTVHTVGGKHRFVVATVVIICILIGAMIVARGYRWHENRRYKSQCQTPRDGD